MKNGYVYINNVVKPDNYVLIIIVLLATISCSPQQESEKVVIKKSNVIKQVLGVDGMTCMGCEKV